MMIKKIILLGAIIIQVLGVKYSTYNNSKKFYKHQIEKKT